MTILLALLIAVVAFSLLMTVLVASTRPLRLHDEPIFGRAASQRSPMRRNGPHWMGVEHASPLPDATKASRPPERQIPAFPLPAPVVSRAPEMAGNRAAPIPAPRANTRVNPNTWGRVRAEAGRLKTAGESADTDHVRGR